MTLNAYQQTMSEIPRCEQCAERQARIVILRNVGGLSRRTFVCKECAEQNSKITTRTSFDLNAMFERINKTEPAQACGICGTTMADIIVDAKPGCCRCYGRFSDEIRSAAEKCQGQMGHIGKSPKI